MKNLPCHYFHEVSAVEGHAAANLAKPAVSDTVLV